MPKLKLLSESAIRKKYKDSYKASILLEDDRLLWLPSRCLALNWQMGGGIPYGRIVEIFGYESTGKSMLAADFGVVAQSLGGVLLWGDAENSFNVHWAKQQGLDPDLIEIYGSNDVEGFSDWHRDMIIKWRSILKNNEPILLVCDSIAALEKMDKIDENQSGGKAEMGNRAKLLYQMYRMRNHFYNRMGVCIIMINQVRSKLNATMFESAETTPGGAATKFYSSIRIGLHAGKQIKGLVNTRGWRDDPSKGDKVGRNISIQIHKNKVAPPKNSVKVEVYFLPNKSGYVGFSRYHGLQEIFVKDGVVKRKKGSGYFYKDRKVGGSEDGFLENIINRPKMRKVFIRKSTINTVSKARERLKGIKVNLFPVKVRKDED